MTYLIDTHMLIWWQQDATELSAKARAIMLNPSNTIVVSSITLWEIAIKVALGKLVVDFEEVLQAVNDDGFGLLNFTPTHAGHVRSLPALHRDPFDRALNSASARRTDAVPDPRRSHLELRHVRGIGLVAGSEYDSNCPRITPQSRRREQRIT